VQVDGSAGYCSSGTGTVATACYTYDAEGRRVRRAIPDSGITDDYVYDLSGHYITQMSGTGWWIRGEIYAGGRHLATYETDLQTPTTFFGDADWLGSERVQTAVNGTACESVVNDAFGDGMSTSGSCDPSAKYFTGKERDWESNLDNFGARFYSSQFGRFLSTDPDNAGASDDDPQSWNGYSYVRNSVLNATDPDGLYCVALPNGTYKDVGTEGQSCAEALSASQNNKPSVIVNGDENDEERIQDLANQIAALTSARSFADVARHGIEGSMNVEAARGLLDLPGAIDDALSRESRKQDRARHG
jgi:RHS repeat-associated protein